MKKTKLNWVSVGNMVGLLGSGFYILYNIYVIVIEPFITKQLVGFTLFGFLTLILSLVVFGMNYVYFEERVEEKWEK